MTTATMTIGTRTIGATTRPRRSLEELVDRLMNALTFGVEPEPTTLAASPGLTTTIQRPRRSLEELVNRPMATLTFRVAPEPEMVAASPGLTPTIHEARQLRQAGDVDGALTVLAGADTEGADPKQARWAFTEWRQLVKTRFSHLHPLVYTQGTGRAAALLAHNVDLLEVVAVLGMG